MLIIGSAPVNLFYFIFLLKTKESASLAWSFLHTGRWPACIESVFYWICGSRIFSLETLSKSRLLQLVVAKTPTNILGVLQHFLPTNCACPEKWIILNVLRAVPSVNLVNSSYFSGILGVLNVSQRSKTAQLSSSAHSDRIQRDADSILPRAVLRKALLLSTI